MTEKETTQLLLVEDDASLRAFLTEELEENRYEVEAVGTLQEAIARLQTHLPDIVLSDLRLPDGRGDSLLEAVRTIPVPPPVVLITAFGQVDDAVDALRRGAADFLTKPLNVEHLLLRLDRLNEVRHMRQEVRMMRELSETVEPGAGVERGRSPVWRQIEKQLARIAMTDDPVLITGPSGAGKEVVARSLHRLSPRSARPFVPVNCSGLPENLLESELFGHHAGAFTGAAKPRKGLFAAAEGGTLLLDEIGDMPVEMQTKLLRALQEKRIRPLGSDHEKTVDVRIIAATNRDLGEHIRNGSFREDLFYRLETFHLELPALRDRPEDIEMFVARFIAESSKELDSEVNGIEARALQLLKGYRFPGNVRELKNIIRRAVTFAEGPLIKIADLPEKLREVPTGETEAFQFQPHLLSMDEMRRSYARFALERCEGNKRRTAQHLQISRHTLYSLLG